MNMDLYVSIVLFKSNKHQVQQAIDSVYASKLNFKLCLVDNSPTDDLKSLKRDDRMEYIFNNANLGFGKAHNIAMLRSLNEAKYHLVLNPDVDFDNNVLTELFQYMEAHTDVGLISPKVLYPDGKLQPLCKLLPSPTDLFLRRFLPFWFGAKERNRKYELLDSGYDKIMTIPYLPGCFMFFRTSALKTVGLFDERYFIYMEDTDLSRRMAMSYKTIYFPHVFIYHGHARESYGFNKLLLLHIQSAIKYFNKWGWIFDRHRRIINSRV